MEQVLLISELEDGRRRLIHSAEQVDQYYEEKGEDPDDYILSLLEDVIDKYEQALAQLKYPF